MIYANCGAIAVIASMTYMTIMEFFDECPAPFSPEMTYMHYYQWKQKEAPKLAVEGK